MSRRIARFACSLLLLTGSAAMAAPIRTLADLESVTIYEITFGTTPNTYAPDAAQLLNRSADPLGAGNNDFTFVANEYYDVFYSDSDGTPNPYGAFLTIEGVWRSNGGPGGMNVNEVELTFGGASPHTQFGDFVSDFEYGTGNVTAGSESTAVDHDLGTFPRFGNTSTTDLNDRFRLTIGFDGISVPEPRIALLLAAAFGYALVRRTR
jgi:hypothetical protein